MPSDQTPSSSRAAKLADLRRQLPGWQFNEMWQALEASSDAAAALLATAQADLALEEAICEHFLICAEDEKPRLFENSAPLSSFQPKIHLCYALGVFGPIVRSDLLTIAKIRNTFAHAKVPLSFSTDAIRAQCLSLKAIEACQAAGKYRISGLIPDPNDARSMFIVTCLGLAMTITIGRKFQSDGKFKISLRMGTPDLP